MSKTRQKEEPAWGTVPGADQDVQIFSSIKYEIMQLLKREGQSDLEGLSKKLSISQMAVYKHVKELEARGLLDHQVRRIGVGRPRLVFRPSAASSGVYPKGYSKVVTAAVDFVQDRLGKEGLEGVFGRMQERAFADYSQRLGDGGLSERVRKLAALRDADGYMAEAHATKSGMVELIHRNCPVSCTAVKHPELCEAERRMYERLVGAKVEAVRVDPEGTDGCRFRVAAT